MSFPRSIARILASQTLSVALFVYLLVLLYLGTVEQAENGLFAAREKYFESLYLVYWLFGALPLVLPGAGFVLALLALNLLAGGLIAGPRGWSHFGLYLTHLGVLGLIVGMFVSNRLSEHGRLTLFEGESADYFESGREWELGLYESGTGVTSIQHKIPHGELLKAANRVLEYEADWLPFIVRMQGYLENAELRPAGPLTPEDVPVIDGFFLQQSPAPQNLEDAIPGLYLSVHDMAGHVVSRGIVWGLARNPFQFEIAGHLWAASLQHKRHQLPFAITLDYFEHAFHPGTKIPMHFLSHVSLYANGMTQEARIAMNEPLRHQEYTLYLSSWGPVDAAPGARRYSVFTVVRNPLANWPLYACCIILFGLLLHFVWKPLQKPRTGSGRESETPCD
jgi:hypothetical protein